MEWSSSQHTAASLSGDIVRDGIETGSVMGQGEVEVLEQPGLPAQIGVAARAEAADGQPPVDADAPPAGEPLEAHRVVTPLPERIPSHWRNPPPTDLDQANLAPLTA